eukprot:5607060-Amphidinium_carterae.1
MHYFPALQDIPRTTIQRKSPVLEPGFPHLDLTSESHESLGKLVWNFQRRAARSLASCRLCSTARLRMRQ